MDDQLRTTIDAAARGERSALNSLFARNMPRLMAFLRIKTGSLLASRESISDLAQSVCREVLRDLDDFEYRGDEAFRAWLFLQATRKIHDRYRYLRSARRDVVREEHPALEEEASEDLLQCYATLSSPSRLASAREELVRIEAALEKLPEAQREAVALSRVMNLPNARVAELLDLSESAVRGLIARGLARLSSLLQHG